MLQCVAVCCSALQCVAVCYSVLQSIAVIFSVLQCFAAYCSVLHCVAVCFIVKPTRHLDKEGQSALGICIAKSVVNREIVESIIQINSWSVGQNEETPGGCSCWVE